MRKVARLKLDLEPDPEVDVIGISSHVKDHRLCWSLNRKLGLLLTRRRAPIAVEVQGRMQEFAAFDHVDEELQGGFTLVNNHGSDGILLRELKHADLFLIKDHERPETMDEVLRKVREADFVLTAFPLEFAHLKEGHKLLL